MFFEIEEYQTDKSCTFFTKETFSLSTLMNLVNIKKIILFGVKITRLMKVLWSNLSSK